MVSLQFWKKKPDEPIAKVLKQLQSQINTHEIRVSFLRQKQRSITGQITLYSVLIYLAYLVYYALGKNYRLKGQTLLIWTLKLGVIFVFPVMYVYALISADERVFGLRRVVKWWYTRSIDREIQEKEALKKRLEGKIEELKEKSDYYNTQQLLERYDSKSVSKGTSQDKVRDTLQINLPPKYPSDNPRHQQSFDGTLYQRGTSRPPVPPLPPPITPSTFAPPQSQPLSQNIPQFHPSAFSPPPSPTLPQQHSKTLLDRVFDLLVGEDENAAENRYALICRHCRAHNGLAPPGERGDDVGYLCGRCGGWNGPEPNKQQGQESSIQQSNSNNGSKSEERAERVAANEEHNNAVETQEIQRMIGEKPQE